MLKTHKLFLFFTFNICCLTSIAQTNLVPNPSFEDTLYCPNGTNQIDAAMGWLNFGNTPDYFNACAPISLNVPNSQFGFQYAHSGVAMAGLVTYVWQFAPDWPYYREYIGIPLTNQLIIGEKYYLSFFLNFTGYLPGAQKIGANKIGMKFSTVPYTELSPPALNNFAHLYTDSIYTDSTKWNQISGSFIADSTYNYLIVGNFFDEIQTDTLIFDGPPFGGSCSYYYLDDICVTTDSIYNENWTYLQNNILVGNAVNLFPNPSSGLVNIETHKSILSIDIYNPTGQIVYSENNIYSKKYTGSFGFLEAGIYYVKIRMDSTYRFFKLFIIN